MRVTVSSLRHRPKGSVLSVKGSVGDQEVEVALDTQCSTSVVAGWLIPEGSEVKCPERVQFGVGTAVARGRVMLKVIIDGVTRELEALVVDGLVADVVVGFEDCRRWGFRWDSSTGRLFLGNQEFWEHDGMYEPYFTPVQVVMEEDDLRTGVEKEVVRTLTAEAEVAEEQAKEESSARDEIGVWHDFTLDDDPPEEELEDLARLEAPPTELTEAEATEVRRVLAERVKDIPGGVEMILRHAKCFENTLRNPGCAEVVHRIDTGSSQPFVDPPRKYSLEKRKFLLGVQKDWSERGIIEPSTSEWVSNPHCARDERKPGGYRPCGDYRGLNKKTIPDEYPADSMDRVYDVVRRADLVTKMDGVDGYFAIPIDPADRHKTAIRLPVTENTFGLFQLKVALFGLRNAGASYDRWMNRIIAKFDRPSAISLRDDIFIATSKQPGEADEQHRMRHLREVEDLLELLYREGARLKPSKLHLCVPCDQPLEVLGYVLQNKRLRKRDSDMDAIKNFPTPTTKLQLQRFLGAVEWVRRFIPALARTEGPLIAAGAMPDGIKAENQRLKKEGKPLRRNWDLKVEGEALRSFEHTKKAILEAVELSVFHDDDKTWETIIALDAGGGALAGVLMQRKREGPPLYQIVACASRRMSSAELGYVPMEQELLSIYYCLRQWSEFVEGKCVVIWSDHQPLKYMVKQVTEHSRGRVTRWFLFMQDQRMVVEHVPGTKNEFPDALTRMLEDSSVRGTEGRVITMRDGETVRVVVEREEGDEDQAVIDIVEDQRSCPEVNAIRHWIDHGVLPEMWEVSTSSRAQALKEMIVKSADAFDVVDQVLYVVSSSGRRKLVVPVKRRRELTVYAHDSPMGGHRDAKATLKRLQRQYIWPSIESDIQNYCDTCPDCDRTKRPWPQRGDLHPLDVTKLFEYVQMDLIGPLPTTLSGNAYILSLIDRATRRVTLIPIPNKEARTVARAFVKQICWYGTAPASIQTDQGTEFVNAVVKNMTHLLGISHVKGAAYHPQTNGLVERMNLPVEQMLAIFGDAEQKVWDLNVDFVMYALNNTVSTVTGETPNFLTYGRRALEPFDLLLGVDPDPVMSRQHWLDRLKLARELAARWSREAAVKLKQRYDKDRKPHDVEVGDLVWVQEKRTPPGVSAKLRPKASEVQYRVEALSGGGDKHVTAVSTANPLDVRKVHVDRTKKVKTEVKELFGEEIPKEKQELSDEYIVDRILGRREEKGTVEYLVRWLGYGPQDDQWVKEANVAAPEKIEEFLRAEQLKGVRLSEPKMLTYAEVAKKPTTKVRVVDQNTSRERAPGARIRKPKVVMNL